MLVPAKISLLNWINSVSFLVGYPTFYKNYAKLAGLKLDSLRKQRKCIILAGTFTELENCENVMENLPILIINLKTFKFLLNKTKYFYRDFWS